VEVAGIEADALAPLPIIGKLWCPYRCPKV